LVAQNSPVSVKDESSQIQSWSAAHKVKINFSKTKEIVFHRSSARKFVMLPILSHIERVNQVILSGVLFVFSLKATFHVDTAVYHQTLSTLST